MDQDLYEQPLGSEGDLELDLKDGNIVLSVSHNSKGAEISLSAAMKTDYFIDKLAEVIPGEIDDAIFNIIKAALKG